MTEQKRKSDELLEEMLELSVRTIRYVMVKKDVPKSVNDQLIRAITSIGANYSEAQDASSKKDFINKIFIAKKESGEAKYWFLLIGKLTSADTELANLIQDTRRFSMMFQKIINTSKGAN